MRKTLLILCCLLALPLSAQTQAPIPPKPRDGGEYWLRDEDTWLDWEVLSSELAGRLTPDWPADESSPEALYNIDWLVFKWPKIVTFSKGERLRAVPDEVGGILIKDIDGGTWMKVQAPNGGFCFVRANGKYVRPVAPRTADAPRPAHNSAPSPVETPHSSTLISAPSPVETPHSSTLAPLPRPVELP